MYVVLDTLMLPSACRCQGDSSGDVQHVAAAMGQDGSVVVAGTVQGKSSDFAAVKLDNDGTLLWDWQVTHEPIVLYPTSACDDIFCDKR